MLDIAALLVSLTAILAWLKHKLMRLPSTIGVMGIALVLSTALVGLGRLGFTGITQQAERLVASVDFTTVLMHLMLSLLLFAGALHVDLDELLSRRHAIVTLATVGVLISTTIVGLAAWVVLGLVGLPMRLTVALALSPPPGPARQVFVPTTYVIVLFSILVQGLSLRSLLQRTVGAPTQARLPDEP